MTKLANPHISQNNLFDSVVNEVEKVSSYETTLNKFNQEEDKITKLANYDVDIMGFILLKNQEIMSDKLLRSFINISHAIERCYTSFHCDATLNAYSTVVYKPALFVELDRIFDSLIHIKNIHLFYDNDINKKLISMSYSEYISERINRTTKLIEENKDKDVTVSIDEFAVISNKLHDRLNSFMLIMRCELESKHNLSHSSIIMKRVYGLVIMIAMILGDLKVE